MDSLSIIAIIFISLFTIVYAYFKYAFGYWKSKRIPYVEPSFPFGNAYGVGQKYHISERLKQIYDEYKPSGAKLVGAYLFATPAAMIIDIELVRNILIRDFSNFSERPEYADEINEPLSARLSHLHGDKWKRSRNKLTPAFSSAKLKVMFKTVVDVGERFCACLTETIAKSIDNDNDDTGLEMHDWCTRFVADSIGSSAFGIECNSLKNPNSEFNKYARKMGLYAMYSPLFLAFLNTIQNVARFLRIKTIPRDVTEFVMKTVADTVEYRRKNGAYRGDFMDTLIGKTGEPNSEGAFTFNEIAAHAMSFFLGTFNNSSTNLTFCLYELSLNPNIQTKARHIIQENFKKYNGQFTYEMMMDMPYIDQIIEETLRKYSPPLEVRIAKKDYAIDGTDIVIEKGILLCIPSHAIHHDSAYYENPERFDPSRFESKAKNARDSITWLSFGSGPRTCIGLRFAMMQARIALTLLLRRFEFSLGSRTTVPLPIDKKSILFTPQDGVYLQVKLLNE